MSRAARTTPLRAYLRDISAYPLLNREQEHDVALRLRDTAGEEAAHHLIHSNLGFVVRVALTFRGRSLPLEDLLNEGNLGLIEAARRFDPARGTRFITFAVHWIRKSILKALARQASLVHLPGQKRRRVWAVLGAERALEAQLGRRPEPEEISERAGVPLRELNHLLRLRPRDVSLEEPIGDSEGLTRRDLLTREHSADPEVDLLRSESREMVASLLGTLKERERHVLVHRYGLMGAECRTLRQIALELGVSREAVRQIEERALKLMERRLKARQGVAGRPAQARKARTAAAAPSSMRA